MDGFSSHTLKLINHENKVTFCKFHFKTDQGIKNLTAQEATRLAGTNPDYATMDLFQAIENKQFPSWTVSVQLMTPNEASKYRWNIFDVTKVWPHKDYPLVPIGKLVLNKNPTNYFAETEQSAFSPSHVVPGIEPSVDKMLQGRLFSYPDTHRHRLGLNYKQIPINRPQNATIHHHQRDGFMVIDGNGGSAPNYEPNSVEKLTLTSKYTPETVSGTIAKHPIHVTDDDFVQAGNLYRLQSEEAKARLVENVARHLKNAKPHIQRRQLEHFKRANNEYGRRIEVLLGKGQTKL